MKKNFIMLFIITIILSFSIAVQAEKWYQDLEEASTEAKTSGKYLLLNFSGSDWCPWCMKLDDEVLSDEVFKTFAEENLVCVLIDFPREKYQSKERKIKNGKLMKKFSVRGFPTVIILSPDGDLVSTTGYRRGGVKKYVAYLKETIDKHKMK